MIPPPVVLHCTSRTSATSEAMRGNMPFRYSNLKSKFANPTAMKFYGETMWPQLNECKGSFSRAKSPAGSSVPDANMTLLAIWHSRLRMVAGFKQTYSSCDSWILAPQWKRNFPSRGRNARQVTKSRSTPQIVLHFVSRGCECSIKPEILRARSVREKTSFIYAKSV